MGITFAPPFAGSHKYQPAIDGLRAIAILPVLFYHAGLPAFSGGFVGVDVFFVISGYLITSIVTKNIELGRFSFAAFYERRMRRIFPALFSVLLLCTAAAAFLFPPSDFRDFGKSLVATTFFASNLFFWQTASPIGYFDDASNSQVLLHTWTLSVEEQFYIFLPIGLVLINRWAKQHLKACLLVATVASFSLSLAAIEYKPIAAFYLLPPRAWELLIGSLLAVGALPAMENRMLRDVAGFCGLGLIIYAVFAFTKDSPFPGIRALAPCLGAWLIIYASQTGASSVKSILSIRPLAFIGVISYSLYLWHWPIIVFLEYFWIQRLTGPQTVLVIFLSLFMAFVSFEFIERPFRRPNSAWTKWQILRLGGSASLACAALGLAIGVSQGFPQRYDVRTQEILAANTKRKTQDWQLPLCGHWHREVHSPEEAASCSLGPTLAKKILFWGDSHVEQLHSSIKRLYEKGALNNHGVLFALAEGCPPTESMNRDVPDSHCDNFGHFVMLRAQREDVDTVFIGFATWWDVQDLPICAVVDGRCEDVLPRAEMERRLIDELSQHIHALKMLGKKVIVALPFPLYEHSIPDLEIHNAMFAWLGSTIRVHEIDTPGLRDRIHGAAVAAGAVLFDPRQSLCDDRTCTYQRGDVSIYTDPSHIADGETGILDENLAAVLR